MKKITAFLVSCLLLSILSSSCNNSSDKKTDVKITDIPATTSSNEALASFNEGLNLLDLGDGIKARAAFSKAITLDPKFGMAYLMRASTGTSAKQFADDVASGKANVDSASAGEKMYAEALETSLNGDRQKGLELAQKIATMYPDAARAQVNLGNAFSGNNQEDKAREYYAKAIELNPKWVGGFASLAGSYMFNKPLDLKKAEENALKITELAPTSAGAQITLGDCYRAQNDFQKAKDAYAKAVSLDPKAPAAYYKLGHANTYLGNLEEARKNYADAGNNDVDKTGALLNTAFTYLYGDDPKTASKYIMDQVAANPGMETSQKNNCLTAVAQIAVHTGDAATLKTVTDMMKPLNAQINIDLGNTAEVKMYGEAEDLHWQAMTNIANGKFDDAKNNLEAVKKVMEPIKDSRKLEGYEHDMGMLAMAQKKYSDAISHFEKANPIDTYNKYCLAKANEAAGNKDKATALYKEVAAYNFNEVGNALVRNEVKKKLANP